MKLGCSIYLSEPFTKSSWDRLTTFYKAGFTQVFTSLNLPEDDPTVLKARLAQLGQACQKYQLSLVVDVNAQSLAKIGLTFAQPDLALHLKKLGVSALRLDDGVDLQTIANLSHQLILALNASTITTHELQHLQQLKANFKHIQAWHNYYPRPETGLDVTWFTQQNKRLQDAGLTITAFIPGSTPKRGPIHAGLPTLEIHRTGNSLAHVWSLSQCAVNTVMIGDPELNPAALNQLSQWLIHGVVDLHVHLTAKLSPSLINQVLHARPEVAAQVIRLKEARQIMNDPVPALPAQPRPQGSLTLDNFTYQRYNGEVQITKSSLPPDSRVNVVGQIIPADLELLAAIGPDQALRLLPQEE